MASRRALREELVRRRLLEAAEVDAALAANRVRVNGAVVANPASLVAAADSVSVVEEPSRWVSRGGRKLDGAITDFGLMVQGRRCVDVGSSTGGFTDCLLQRGAAHVVAVDVGRAQLHHRLLTDDRVTSWESRNILDVSRADLAVIDGFARGAEVIVADLSFTSSARLAGHLLDLVGPGGDIVVLVKPQFEARRDEVPEGGVVRDPAVQERAVARVAAALTAAGAEVRKTTESRVSGTDGNREFFVWAAPGTHRTQ
ncbi:MAG: TlyA family RNA methyltransferase [Actinobacteria bacterium]|nr:TlyA family RNA methyltransferase [Actinomycetota bacterium]